MKKTVGKVSSIQTLGTLDGPAVRFVIFLQGCNLRCGFCHNPETQAMAGGTEYTPEELIEKALRYKEYFGNEGGITVSGGEPLLQADFVRQLFILAHENGLNTCLDTSGNVINDSVKELLLHCDRALLDIKYPTEELYLKHTGGSLSKALDFLRIASERGVKITLREVIIPEQNDTEESMEFLKALRKEFQSVDKIELLPFKKMCEHKYENMGIPFPLKDIPEPSPEKIRELEEILKQK